MAPCPRRVVQDGSDGDGALGGMVAVVLRGLALVTRACHYCGHLAHLIFFRKPESLWVCDGCVVAHQKDIDAMDLLFS